MTYFSCETPIEVFKSRLSINTVDEAELYHTKIMLDLLCIHQLNMNELILLQ